MWQPQMVLFIEPMFQVVHPLVYSLIKSSFFFFFFFVIDISLRLVILNLSGEMNDGDNNFHLCCWIILKIHDIVKKLRKDLNIQICFGVLSHRPNSVSFFLFSFRNLWGTWTKRWRFRLPWKRCIKGKFNLLASL